MISQLNHCDAFDMFQIVNLEGTPLDSLHILADLIEIPQ